MSVSAELVDRFLARWQGLGGEAAYHVNEAAARLGLLAFLSGLSTRSLLAWPPQELPLPGLVEALADAGYGLVQPERRHLDPNLSVGVTAADAGLAATGSLVLARARARSWLPALTPIRHIILLPQSRLHADLAAWRQAWRRAGREQDLCHNLIITGPSFSDDIELHQHRGMFGPRHLYLVLFDDAEREEKEISEREEIVH